MRTTRVGLCSEVCLVIFLAIAVAVVATGTGCGPNREAEHGAAPKREQRPALPKPPWVGSYDKQQQQILDMPLDAQVEQPALPVYPVLSRFTFTGEGTVEVPNDLLAYANLVTEALSSSPLLYVFRSGPPSLANLRALYGPEPSKNPDPWRRVMVDASQRPSLVPALPDDAVRVLLNQASRAPSPDKIKLLQQAAQQAKGVPGVHVMLADAALASDDSTTAEHAARAALAIDPAFPHAYRVLAEVALRSNDMPDAKEAVARALALYPTYPRAWKVAEAIAGRTLERVVGIDQPFIEVNGYGAIVVVACDRPFCSGYAACKAAFRFERAFRASVLQQPESEPYHLSGTEEVVCVESGLGAHLDARQRATPEAPATPDPTAELLVRLAAEAGLTGYAMFEVLGQHRPEWLRVAPRPVHDAVVAYVLQRVLGTPVGAQRPTESTGEPVTASAHTLKPAGG